MRASSVIRGTREREGQGRVPVRYVRDARGTILLEVVLALALFVAAAAIIGAGFSASVESVDRQRLSTHAVNLAVSSLSEVQMGIRKTDESGPIHLSPPFEKWSSELIITPVDSPLEAPAELTQVEVVIRHLDPPVVYRMAQFLNLAAPRGTVHLVEAR